MKKIAQFCDFEIFMDSEFKGQPYVFLHYNEDNIDGQIDLTSGEVKGDFDKYLMPILVDWFENFKTELLQMWNDKNLYLLADWE